MNAWYRAVQELQGVQIQNEEHNTTFLISIKMKSRVHSPESRPQIIVLFIFSFGA